MTRKIVVSLLSVIVLLAGGGGAFMGLVALKSQSEPLEPEHVPLVVNAVTLQPVTVIVPLEGFGTARAQRAAVVGAQVSGQIVERPASLQDGVTVERGQLLLHIDDRDYQAQLERARSILAADTAAFEQLDVEQRNIERLIETADDELKVAEREYARVLDLFEQEVSNPRELDAARVVVKRARRTLLALENERALLPVRRTRLRATIDLRKAELTLAELNVERCTVVAPFSGRVERVSAEVGEQVGPGQALLSLIDPTLLEVPIELPLSQRADVRVGRGARLLLESNERVVWTGRVARVAPSADEATRTFALFVEVDNRAQAEPLMPGMFLRAHIDGPTLENVLLVPRAAVRRQRVFVCTDGQAHQRGVDVQRYLAEHAVISGLAPGQIVITSNLDALHDGAPVRPALTHDQEVDDPTSAAPAADAAAKTP